MKIRIAREEDLPIIQKIAHETWPATYGHLMSEEQFSFMMNWMYSLESLRQQQEQGQVFLLAEENGTYYGFASYEAGYQESKTKIHKLYILPASQGKGVGRLLTEHVKAAALANNNSVLTLNVKRDNTALEFYKRVGFTITDTVDIDIGHGYLMRDFVMEMPIKR